MQPYDCLNRLEFRRFLHDPKLSALKFTSKLSLLFYIFMYIMSEDNQLTRKNIFQLFKDAVSGKEQDFTTGSIRKAVFLLSIPMILEMLMESIFALVDIIYVSRVSVNAVATIGLTESVITLVYAVAIGLSMAATAIVARRI